MNKRPQNHHKKQDQLDCQCTTCIMKDDVIASPTPCLSYFIYSESLTNKPLR